MPINLEVQIKTNNILLHDIIYNLTAVQNAHSYTYFNMPSGFEV